MAIKDYYDLSYIQSISDKMAAVYPAFPKEQFLQKMQAELADQTYSEKMIIISKGLYESFPSYSKALEVFTAILGSKMRSMAEMYEVGMEYKIQQISIAFCSDIAYNNNNRTSRTSPQQCVMCPREDILLERNRWNINSPQHMIVRWRSSVAEESPLMTKPFVSKCWQM